VERIGEMTYVSRGRTLEIYDPLMNLVAKTDLESPLMEMAGFSFQSHSYLYVLTEAGEWLLIDVTDPKGVGKTTIQKNGAFFKNLRIWEPKTASPTPELFITALDQGNGMLWSFNDPANPQVKLQLKGSYKDPRKLLLWGKNLYLADAESLSTLDGTNGILTASLPAGGVVTGLDVVERQGKPFLVVSLGGGEKGPGVGDLGLRIFEIGVAGKLGNERRIHLKGNPSVERLHVVPFTTKLLLGVKLKEELSLRVFDLATESEVPLDLPADLKFAALFDFATGRLNNIPMAVVADASALRVLKFSPVGNPPTRYKVESAKTSFSTLAAGGVRMGPGETSVFLLDLGSMINPLVPALQEISTADFSTKNTLVLGDGSYLSDFALTDRPKFNFAVNLNDASPLSPESQKSSGAPAQTLPSETQPAAPASGASVRGSAEGKLRVFATDTKPMSFFLSVARLFGDQKEGNESRPLGIDALINPNGILVATAVGKISGMGLRTGLTLIRIPPEGDPSAVLKGDLSQKMTYIPLADARDVRLSRDGKWALVAAGIEGLAVVDIEKNKVVIKSNPQQGALADRVLLSNDQKKVFVSFLSASSIPNAEESGEVAGVPASMSIFYFDEGKLGVWGAIKGLSSFTLPYGVRAASGALSSDDLYLFVANGRKGVWAYNASDPSSPVLIAKLPTHGIATAVTVGQKYKNIYIADLVNGLEMAEFGF